MWRTREIYSERLTFRQKQVNLSEQKLLVTSCVKRKSVVKAI